MATSNAFDAKIHRGNFVISEEPTVGVALPTFNRVEQLKNCVVSLMAQDYPNIVVLIVDNASNDDTKIYCRDLVAQDNRFCYSRNDWNVGSNTNFEIARRMISEPYFMWLGDDDRLDRQYISTCIRRLVADPGLVLVSGQMMYHREDGTKFRGVPLNGNNPDPQIRFLEILQTIVDAGGFYGVFRRTTVDTIPLINSWGNDYLFLCETAFRGRVDTEPSVSCFRRDNSGDVSISDSIQDSNMPVHQSGNPYGAIAALFFWQILHGSTFKELEVKQRLLLAINCLQIIHSRWTVLEQPTLIDFAKKIFPDLDIELEMILLRQPLMSIRPQLIENSDTLPTLDSIAELLLR